MLRKSTISATGSVVNEHCFGHESFWLGHANFTARGALPMFFFARFLGAWLEQLLLLNEKRFRMKYVLFIVPYNVSYLI